MSGGRRMGRKSSVHVIKLFVNLFLQIQVHANVHPAKHTRLKPQVWPSDRFLHQTLHLYSTKRNYSQSLSAKVSWNVFRHMPVFISSLTKPIDTRD